jgi:hypothetical protein
MTTREIRCVVQGCGTLNRVPAYRFSVLPKCGKCGAALPEPGFITVFRWFTRHQTMLWLAIPIVAIALFVAALPDEIASDAADECEARPQPRQGIYKWYGAVWGEDVAPFTIETAGNENYFIKLEDEFGRPVRAYFVRGGSTISYKVPAGTFNLKYVTGRSWCGELNYFGAASSFHRADDAFTFDGPHGWTVRLVHRKGGNLRTRPIKKDQF